jgi:hypothetical protein
VQVVAELEKMLALREASSIGRVVDATTALGGGGSRSRGATSSADPPAAAQGCACVIS